MYTIKELELKDKRILMRLDFNVPMDGHQAITDDTRIRLALPTIKYAMQHSECIVMMSHLGRPQKKRLADGSIDIKKFSLAPVASYLSELLGKQVALLQHDEEIPDIGLFLLENTRFDAGESKGDEKFAQRLAGFGEVYINDAFGTAHRRHASTATIAEYFAADQRAIGLLMESELAFAKKLLDSKESPITAIIGGAKVTDKIGIIETLMDRCDHLLIGGAMAYTFIKARGGKVANSLVEDDKLDLALDILAKAERKSTKIHLPVDSVTANAFANEADTLIVNSDMIPDGYMGLDIGPQASAAYGDIIKASKTVFWNGPMGVFEMPSFAKGSFAVAQAIAEVDRNGGFSLVGGGDSVAAINASGLADQVSFISSGGGAMLEFLEGKELPGLTALTT